MQSYQPYGSRRGKKQLTLELQLDSQLGEYFQGAPDRLRQVLTNLIGNAIKFTEQGGVSIRVFPLPQQQVQFSISDTGIGIAPERLEQIFEAFTQADASMSRRFGGTGLGTTISKQLVELMGGRIWAESAAGVGSSFHFIVPLPAGQAPDQPAAGANIQLPPLQLLIADDIPQNLELLSLLLQRAGHTVTTASDGVAAFEAVQQQRFDLVLMDIQMPRLDGLSACRQIRQWEQQQGQTPVPVIALTASVLDDDKHAARQAGMQGFASKPIDFRVLCYEIARVLQIPVEAPLSEHNSHAAATLVNVTKVMQLWGNMAIYLPALRQFLSQQGDALHALEHSNDFEQIQQLAHAIKGVSGNLGLDPLSKVCAELEQAARQQQQTRCSDLLQKILHCWPRFEQEYAGLAERWRQEQPQQQGQYNSAELQQLLAVLAQSLSQHAFDDDRLAQLSQYQGPYQPQVLALLDTINDFEFARAQQLLSALLQDLQHGETE